MASALQIEEMLRITAELSKRPGANMPYESIRHFSLKLPSFGKKNGRGTNFLHAPCHLESRRFPSQLWTRYGVALACVDDLVSGHRLHPTIRAIAAPVSWVFSKPQERLHLASNHATMHKQMCFEAEG